MPGKTGFVAVSAVVAALATAPAAVAGGSGPVGTECSFVNAGQCVAVVSPWIVLHRSGSEGWKLYCPSSNPYNWAQNGASTISAALTYDRSSAWLTGLQVSDPFANRTGPSPPGTADYYATNWDPTARHSYRYGIGCSTESFDGIGTGGPAAGAPTPGLVGRRELTAERALPATGTVTVVRRCPRGTRLAHARNGVGYFTRTAPSRSAHVVRAARTATAITYRVTTNRAPARTRLQTTIVCGTSGA